MRHLVTGGAGFIGSHLVDRLVERGDRVIVLDNMFTGNPNNFSDATKSRTPSLLEVVRGDVIDPFHFEVDRIWHLACPASPVHYQRNPARTIKTGVLGTLNALECARDAGARILIASTSEIYGDPLIHPQPEEYWGNVNTLGPRACYSDDTEALTRRGWVLIGAIQPDDEVACLAEDQRVEYTKPREVIRLPYEGEMIRFVNAKMDLLVTPNHNMIDERHGRQIVRADADVEWHHRRTPTGGSWPETVLSDRWPLPPRARNAKVTFPDVPLLPWLEFVGMYLAEGCVTLTPKTTTVNGKDYEGVQYRVLLAHDHGWKYERIRACLDRLPWKYQELDHQFQITNKQLVDALEPLGRRSITKRVPREYFDLSPSQLRVLFDGMMLDGARDGHSLTTASCDLADDVQEIALRIGLAASVVKYRHESNPYSDREMYRVNLRSAVKACYPEPVRETYSGTVVCLDIPPHRAFFVRRRGKVVLGSNCYDEGKRAAETLAHCYAAQYKVEVRIARIFNTYGPRMAIDDGRVVSNFIAQALQGEAPTIYGDGSQTRSFCFVDDTVKALLRLMDQPEALLWREIPVNIGNPGEFTMNELAALIRQLVPGAPEPTRHPLPKDDPARRKPDITRARELLGWAPKIALEEGLRRTISDFAHRLGRPA